jgi:hypothetical protein
VVIFDVTAPYGGDLQVDLRFVFGRAVFKQDRTAVPYRGSCLSLPNNAAEVFWVVTPDRHEAVTVPGAKRPVRFGGELEFDVQFLPGWVVLSWDG